MDLPRREGSTVNWEFSCLLLLPGICALGSLPRTLKSATLNMAGEIRVTQMQSR